MLDDCTFDTENLSVRDRSFQAQAQAADCQLIEGMASILCECNPSLVLSFMKATTGVFFDSYNQYLSVLYAQYSFGSQRQALCEEMARDLRKCRPPSL